MKIIRLEAENVKRLRCVSITPARNIVEITGNNGEGKSSVLDSIWYCLGGGSALPEVPVRKGAEKAHVSIDLGELQVERTFTAGGTSSLRVTAKGERQKSPQAILDSLVGKLTFDPLAFSRMRPDEQLATLKSIVKLDVDVDALERQNQQDYDQRTEINRQEKSLRAQIDSLKVPDDTPEEEINIGELAKELDAIGKRNLEIEKAKERKNSLNRQSELAASEAERCEKEIKELEQKIENLKGSFQRFREMAKSYASEAALIVIGTPESSEQIQARIREAQEVNHNVQKLKRLNSLILEAEEKREVSARLTRQIEDRNEQKRLALERANMPVPGLSFGNGQVIFNGVPFSQASAAEKLRVSCAIAAALNPKLRIIRVEDGSLLDDHGMETLAEFAEKNDLQIWIERVVGSTPSAVIMEAGEIKKNGKS